MDKDIHFFFSCTISERESSREDMKIKRQGKVKTLCLFLKNYNYLKVISFGPVNNMSQAHLQGVSPHDSNVWDGPQIPAYNLNKLPHNVPSAPQFPAAVERPLCPDSCRTRTDTGKWRVQRKAMCRQSLWTVWRIRAYTSQSRKSWVPEGEHPCSGSTEGVREGTGALRKLDASFTKSITVRRNSQRVRCAQQPVTRDSEQGYGVRRNK